MRVLLAGRMEGWMQFHLSHLARGFRQEGVDCEIVNYRTSQLGALRRRVLGDSSEEVLGRRRTDALIGAARDYRADIVLTYRERFDFERLREATKAAIVFWDWDGMAGAPKNPDFPPEYGIDLVLTVSRPVERMLRERTRVPVRYLPHGVDLDAYSPVEAAAADRLRFGAPLTFVGRASDRRAEYLEAVADLGLALWGKRWRERKWRTERLRGCVRGRKDIIGEDLIKVYRSSDVVLNILRLLHAATPSMLSLQVFSVPATGTCLLTEWLEELGEAFEPDREVLSFRSSGEMRELAQRYTKDTALARRIGEAGRRRCAAEHSHAQRAGTILKLVHELG